MTRKRNTAVTPLTPPKKAFDLASRFVRDTVEVKILDPVDDTDTGIRIGIRSVYSTEARAAARAARAQIVLDDKGKVVSSPTETLDAIVEQTIGATAYWKADEGEYADSLLIGGEKISCTPDAVRKLYSDPKTAWIQRQVQAVYLDLAGFFDQPKTA